jgi:uncharacterized protein DUF5677
VIINDYEISFGDEKAQEDFAKQHFEFLKAIPNLKEARSIAQDYRPQATFEVRLMFVLQQVICEEDFDSILQLLANGLSMTAMQILRAMFEHTVTLAHIGKNPDEAMLFWEYYWVDKYKGEKDKFDQLAPEVKERIEENHSRVKQAREAGGYKDHRFWSASNIRKMAKDLDVSDDIIKYAYDRPLEETHGTAAAVLRRIEVKPDGGLNFALGAKPAEDNMTLMLAHQFAVISLKVLKEYCGVKELEEPVEQCEKDYQAVWNAKAKEISERKA